MDLKSLQYYQGLTFALRLRVPTKEPVALPTESRHVDLLLQRRAASYPLTLTVDKLLILNLQATQIQLVLPWM
jgi:hypothetical protein